VSDFSERVEGLVKSLIEGSEFEGKVWAAGGWVRDSYLERESKDLDVVVEGLHGGIKFAEFVAKKQNRYKKGSNPVIHQKFGTAAVRVMVPILEDWCDVCHETCETPDGLGVCEVCEQVEFEIECVFPRKEEYESDSRKPIVSAATLKEDIWRRDMTLNALVKNLSTGEVRDLTGGLKDLKAGLIRTPLDPDVTYSEDPLRMLRAIRFACVYGWEYTPEVWEALFRNAYRLEIVSKERVRVEFEKMLCSSRPSQAIRQLMETGLMKYMNEEMSTQLHAGVKMAQNKYHTHDVFEHQMVVLESSLPTLVDRLSALFHDIGKPSVRTPHPDGQGGFRFLEHELESRAITERVMKSLKFPSDLIDEVGTAVRCHMGMKDPKSASDKAVRKWVRKTKKVGDYTPASTRLLSADALGHKVTNPDDPGDVRWLVARIEKLGAAKPENLRQSLVTGYDLIEWGLKPGIKFKVILDWVQDVVDGEPNVERTEMTGRTKVFIAQMEQ